MERVLLGDWQQAVREWHRRLAGPEEGERAAPSAYLVGGALRDALLGRLPVDIDVALSGGSPLEVGQALAKLVDGSAVLLDRERQMVRVAASHLQPPHLDLTPLRGTVIADLRERDFTCNALALPLGAAFDPDWPERLIDPFGGRVDLEARRLRVVHDGVFHEDPVRLLRAARLAAELELTVEPGAEEAIARNAPLVSEASGERIRDELVRLLLVPHAAPWVERLDKWDLLCRVLPELGLGKGVDQPFFHFWDVFQHHLHALAALEVALAGLPTMPNGRQGEQAVPLAGEANEVPSLDLAIEAAWSPTIEANLSEELGGGRPRLVVLKLATLLHDIGKPATKTVEPDGRTRFFGHAEVGAAMAAKAMERLRFSRREIETVQILLQEHLRPTQMGHPPSDRALYRFFRDLGEEAYSLLLLHLADARATHGPSIDLPAWESFLRSVGEMLRWRFAPPRRETPHRLIDGHALMAALNLSPGPLIGRLLEAVEEARALGQVRTREEALAYAARLVPDQAPVTDGFQEAV